MKKSSAKTKVTRSKNSEPPPAIDASVTAATLAQPLPLEHPLQKRLISYHELPSMGISFSIIHLRRMWRDGRFPEPVYTSVRRFAWPIDVIDQWIKDRKTTPNMPAKVRGRAKAEA